MDAAIERRRYDIIFGALALGAPLIVYIATLAPSVTFEDSGQLITAAARLGISHPSGYPLAALIGQFFTLLPFHGMAWRVNLASAAAAAGASFFLFLLLRRLLDASGKADPKASATAGAAALTLAFSRTFWSQAVITEVYALNALVIVAFLYAALTWAATTDPRWGFFTAFLGGFAFPGHSSSALITVPLVVYLAAKFRRAPSLRALCLGLALVALGGMVYLYLPLRAIQGPAIDWGDPRTLGKALFHIMRRAYGGPVVGRLEFLPRHLWELARFLGREFTLLGAVALAGGFFWAAFKSRPPWRLLAVLALITGPAATVALVLLLQGHQLGEISVWYVPCYIMAAALVGRGLHAAVEARQRWFAPVGAGVIAAVPVLALVLNFPWNDFRRYYYAEDFGANFLRTISFEGINIMYERGSLGTFETAYLKKVEWFRPDHVFVDATGNVYRDYPRFGEGRYVSPSANVSRAWERGFEQGLLELYFVRGVYYSVSREEVNEYGYTLEPTGMLFRVYREPTRRRAVSPVWRRYVRRGNAELAANLTTPRRREDVWARDAFTTYEFMLAREYFLAGEKARALATLEAAAPAAAEMTESLAELGNIYFMNGYTRPALKYYTLALAAFPRAGKGDDAFRLRYAQILANKAVVYIYRGDLDAAERTYRESLAVYPHQPDVILAARRENIERMARALGATPKR